MGHKIILTANFEIPPEFKKRIGELHQGNFKDFLKKITPVKKQSESDVIEELRSLSDEIAVAKKLRKKTHRVGGIPLTEHIGNTIARLFDYPKIGDDSDDEKVLYEALSRHFIIVFNTFRSFQNLPTEKKEQIYDSFLDKVLENQLWSVHKITNSDGNRTYLNREILKTEISKIAEINFAENRFKILPEKFRLISEPIVLEEDHNRNISEPKSLSGLMLSTKYLMQHRLI